MHTAPRRFIPGSGAAGRSGEVPMRDHPP